MKIWSLCVAVMVLAVGVEGADPETPTQVEGREEKAQVLERNIRLDFKMVPLEEDDRGVFLVTASSWYQTSTRFEGEGLQIEFEVSGHVRVVDGGRFFVTYEGHVEFSGEEQEAVFHVDSSALLRPGQELEVASMGEKTLVVCASYVEVKQSEE